MLFFVNFIVLKKWCCIILILLFCCFISSKLYLGVVEERQFLQWMRINNKFYIGDEYHFRLGIFISNIRYFQEFNRWKDLTFHVGINKFSCYTPTEYKSLLGVQGFDQSFPYTKSANPLRSAPDSFDWRDKGVVNPIKNQGDWGSCWAFSAISTSESAYAISTGNLLHFSEQDLVDCSPGFGCRSGWSYIAIDYILEDQHPYTATDA